MSKGIYVIVEQRGGEIQKVSIELIGKARELVSDGGNQVVAVLMGYGIGDKAKLLGEYGAHRVIVIDHPILENYITEPYVKAIEYIIRKDEPDIVLFGATSIGRDMAPRVAGRVHTGLTADCTRLDIDVEKYKDYLRKEANMDAERLMKLNADNLNLKMTRPAFGGNIMATIICPEYRPQMATVRPGVMSVPERIKGRLPEITEIDVGLSDSDKNVEITDIVYDEKKEADITEAKLLISGGRGVGNSEGFEPLKELAEELGGEVASSRIGVDNGWIEKARQVGQTGKTVRPQLYMALGISGAIQHLAGMESSEYIIAVNKDATCPMMKMADLGIVGDLKVIVPKLTDAIKKYRESQRIE